MEWDIDNPRSQREMAERFNKIWRWANKMAAGRYDRMSMLVNRLTQEPMTSEQAMEQTRRIEKAVRQKQNQ